MVTRPKDELNAMELLQGFRRGQLLHEMDDALTRVVTAIRDTGGSGSITIKIPFKMNRAGQLECAPTVEAKVPREAMGTGIYFASADGRLSRRDHRQADIEDYIDGRPGLSAAN
jgi:hypothetical protein